MKTAEIKLDLHNKYRACELSAA